MMTSLTLVSNVYALTDEEKIKAVETTMAAQESSDLLKETNKITEKCTLLAQLELITDECTNFIVDFRDSLKGVLDRYEATGANITMSPSETAKMIGNLLK